MTTFPCFQRKPRRRTAWPFLRRLCLFPALVLGLGTLVFAQGPQWWANGVLTNMAITNDYAPANAGQLKNLAWHAYQEMQATFPGGAAAAVSNLVFSLAPGGDFSPVNVGQLKYVAQPFYSNLIAIGYTSAYPWAGSPTPNDFAPANIGQLKNVFGFDLTDTDGDGLFDGVEVQQGTDPAAYDTDHDGWRDGLDPDPRSRAWVDWGNSNEWPGSTAQITNRYWPAWCKGAKISSGSNDYAASSFNVASNAPLYQGIAYIVVDTNLVQGTDMALWTRVSTSQVGQLYFQLRNMAWTNLIDSFLGSPYNPQYPLVINTATLTPSNGEILLKVPMSNLPSAANIICHRYTNAIAIYDSMLFMDSNGDFLDDTQMAAITANPTNDYDADGLADFWEFTHGFDFTRSDQDGNGIIDGLDDFDEDGRSNAEELACGYDPYLSDTDPFGLYAGNESAQFGYSNPILTNPTPCLSAVYRCPGSQSAYGFALQVAADPDFQNILWNEDAGVEASRAWTRIWGSGDSEWGEPVAVDSNGKVYVAVDAGGSWDGQPYAGQFDFALCKWDANGQRDWTRMWGTPEMEMAKALAVDETQNRIYVAGETRGALGGQTNAGHYDACLTQLDMGGTQQWVRLWGTSDEERTFGVGADPSGNVYVTGYTLQSMDGQPYSGQIDCFLSKFNSGGDRLWTRQWGSNQSDEPRGGLCVDTQGFVYVVGRTDGAFGGQTNSGGRDAFIAKFSPSGDLVWTRLLGSSSTEEAKGIAIAPDGSLYVGGQTWGALGGQTNCGGADIFLAKLTPDGDTLWTRMRGSSGSDLGGQISLDGKGNAYVLGVATNAFDGQTTAGSYDSFVCKFDSSGHHVWTHIWGSPGDDDDSALAADAWGHVYVSGSTLGQFDGQTNNGQYDAFLTRLDSEGGSCPIGPVAAGARCSDIRYAGPPLEDGRTNYWRIRFFTTNGQAGSWSVGTNLFILINGDLDTDDDGMPDWWESRYFYSPTNALASADSDADGLGNLEEYRYGTDPQSIDSDADGIPDGEEIRLGINPQLSNDYYVIYYNSLEMTRAMVPITPPAELILQFKNKSAGVRKCGFNEFTSSNILATVPPKIYLTKGKTYNSDYERELESTPSAPDASRTIVRISAAVTETFPENGVGCPYECETTTCSGDYYKYFEKHWHALEDPVISTETTTADWTECGTVTGTQVNVILGFTNTTSVGINTGIADIEYGVISTTMKMDSGDGWTNTATLYDELTDDRLMSLLEGALNALPDWNAFGWDQRASFGGWGQPPDVRERILPDPAHRFIEDNHKSISVEYLRYRWRITSDADAIFKVVWAELAEDLPTTEAPPDPSDLSFRSTFVKCSAGEGLSDEFQIDPPGDNGQVTLQGVGIQIDAGYLGHNGDESIGGILPCRRITNETSRIPLTFTCNSPGDLPLQGVISRSSERLQLYTANEGGVPLQFDGTDNKLAYDELPMIFYAEGGEEASPHAQADWIRFELENQQDVMDQVFFTVFDMSLGVDANFDGVIDSQDEIPDTIPTAVIGANRDDDNHNGIVDTDDAGTVAGENNLEPILLTFEPPDLLTLVGELTLDAGNAEVVVWKRQEKGQSIPLPATWRGTNPIPMNIYIEGLVADWGWPMGGTLELKFDADNLIASDQVRLILVQPNLIPDYDHNRKIDVWVGGDYNRATNLEPYHFWINDDNDDGDVANGNSDVPGIGDGNADHDNAVNGYCDLPDFFPVWLDVAQPLYDLPSDRNWYFVLRQADSALNFFHSGLTALSAGDYLTKAEPLYGWGLDYPADTIPVTPVTSTGTDIDLYGRLAGEIMDNPRKGVLLFEGKTATQNPLILEIREGSENGKRVCEAVLPLRLSGVEDMCRWINLRTSGGLPTSTGEPANNPDSLSNGKNVFFLHGFNVDANAARGWNAEMFKRLYQAGSRAKFWGMTWEGDVGLINALHYQDDVANGLTVSSNFYAQVHGITGDKIVLGHSLGNMVVSSAIQDYGLSVSKYFMLNAAVATECYDPSVFNDATGGNYMLHEDWSGYSNKTWCSTWFRLFSSPDDREKLTWQNRFPAVMSVAYNFYSSGDEIFEVYAGTPSAFSGGLFHLERRAWQKQEVFKGRGILGGTTWAGWGFSGENVEDDVGNVIFVPEYSAEEANGADEARLRTNAVFWHEPTTMFSSNITTNIVNDIIAQGVPALSYAAGGNSINIPGFYNYNVDDSANKPNGWGRRGGTYGTRWLHSDLKNMAYLYTYQLFNELISQGGLQ